MYRLLLNKMVRHRLIAWLFIVSVLMTLANNIVYIHSHLLGDGTIVIHAHPFNKSGDKEPFKAHFHSDAHFSAIQHLSVLFFTVAAIAFLAIEVSGYFYFTARKRFLPKENYQVALLRAPPAMGLNG